jgi:pSer/pThr/pTyr-binding forkhead associated (FHA) protein
MSSTNNEAPNDAPPPRGTRRARATKQDPQATYDPSRTYMMNQAVRPEQPLRFVGLLRPEKGVGAATPVTLEEREVIIGRQEDLKVSLPDDWVSRRHAKIRRVGDEYVLQDLGSSNGTYVDGVPILSCVLRQGDWIQIGRNLFRFEIQLAGASGVEDLSTWLE